MSGILDFFKFLLADKTISREAAPAYKQTSRERYRVSKRQQYVTALSSFLKFIGLGEYRVKLF